MLCIVEPAQPVNELQDDRVPPHPDGEAPEAPQRLLGRPVLSDPAYEPVHAVGVGPVGLDGDRAAGALGDQALGDLGTFAIELVRSVRGLADQHEACLACAREQPVEVPALAGERVQRLTGIHAARERRAAGPTQKLVHLLVAGLGEVLVPQPHGMHRPWRGDADHLVGEARQRFAHLGGRNGDRDDHARRVVLSNRLHGGGHRRSGGKPVVNEDNRAAGELRRRRVPAVGPLATLQLAPLLGVDRLDPFRRQPQPFDQLLVEHAHSAAGDRAERELFMAGQTELAHDVDVQRDAELAGHLIRHRYAAPRQTKHHDILAPRVVA